MKKVLSILVVILIFSSCKKNQLGGDSTITGSVKHHSKIIPGATVYIKFNAKEFPGKEVSVYDANTTADSQGNFKFDIYQGDYFLFAKGTDKSLDPTNQTVTGGVPVHIRKNEDVTADVAVTEEH